MMEVGRNMHTSKSMDDLAPRTSQVALHIQNAKPQFFPKYSDTNNSENYHRAENYSEE